MFRRKVMCISAAATVLVATAAFARGSLFQGDSPLERAHAAYLENDMRSMTGAVREALSEPDADRLVRENAFDLLRRAAREHKGKLEADWTPPPGVGGLKFAHIRKQKRDRVSYKINFAGSMEAADTLAQVQVVRFPDEVVLDRRAGVGEWFVTPDVSGFYFDMDSADSQVPYADGLYLVRFVLANGLSSEGWFVMSDLTSSASPILHSPGFDETVFVAQPTIAMEDFTSPEAKPEERRAVRINVGRLLDGSPGWAPVWGLSDHELPRTSATVGQEPGGDGPESSLTNGDYWLTVTYYESRQFGPVKLRRGSRNARPFHVVLP